jgi:hypothetical protein
MLKSLAKGLQVWYYSFCERMFLHMKPLAIEKLNQQGYFYA